MMGICSKEEEQKIAKEYIDGESSKFLCKKYGYKTEKSIIDKVVKYYGKEYVRTNRESLMLNKEYSNFTIKRMDSKFNAYFLGLQSSDGCIHEEKNCVEQSMTDEDVIKFISEIIGKKYSCYHRTENRKDIYRIIINNKEFIEDLKQFNIVKRKTHILKGFDFLKEEIKFIPYYIRGCIDGDGWIRKDGKEFFICSASSEYAEWLKWVLENYLYMETINIYYENSVYYVRTSQTKNINILKDIIYDYPYGMRRKYKLLHG